MTLRDTLKGARIAILDDGVVTLGETSLLLRLIRPFVQRGDAGAVELERLLTRVRRDGRISPEESAEIARELQKLALYEISLGDYVRGVPDFPRVGFAFCDVNRVFATTEGFGLAMSLFTHALDGLSFDMVISPEPYGVSFGAAVATLFGKTFAPICRPGVLTGECLQADCETSLGLKNMQLARDVVADGARVVYIDGVLDRGVMAESMIRMIERAGAQVVKAVFVAEFQSGGARTTRLLGRDVVALAPFAARETMKNQ